MTDHDPRRQPPSTPVIDDESTLHALTSLAHCEGDFAVLTDLLANATPSHPGSSRRRSHRRSAETPRALLHDINYACRRYLAGSVVLCVPFRTAPPIGHCRRPSCDAITFIVKDVPDPGGCSYSDAFSIAELLAEPVYVGVQVSCFGVVAFAPYGLQDHLPGADLAGVTGQE